MQINGFKMPIAFVIPTLIFTFWLGGISIKVMANEDAQKQHQSRPAHEKTIGDLATIKASVQNNKESLARLEAQMQKDKEEILRAIRESK